MAQRWSKEAAWEWPAWEQVFQFSVAKRDTSPIPERDDPVTGKSASQILAGLAADDDVIIGDGVVVGIVEEMVPLVHVVGPLFDHL